MYVKKVVDKIKWDNIIVLLPFIFAYVIFMIEADHKARFVIALSLFIIIITYLNVKNNEYYNKSGESNRYISNLILRYGILAVPVYLSWYKLSYFLIGVITIILFTYKIFEFIGDKIESVFSCKLKVPLSLTSLIKLCIWLLGFTVFITLFFAFIAWFVTLYPNHSVTLMLLNSHHNIVTGIGVALSSLIIAVFIIDFLIKMIFINLKPISFKSVSRFEMQQLFLKAIIVIIFADLAYSLMYMSFSGIKLKEVSSFNDYLLFLVDYFKVFYYTFSIHFSIPLPTTSFINELDSLVKETPSMQIIQFFHFCLNKIVDITILAYMAGIILNALGFKKDLS